MQIKNQRLLVSPFAQGQAHLPHRTKRLSLRLSFLLCTLAHPVGNRRSQGRARAPVTREEERQGSYFPTLTAPRLLPGPGSVGS